jgi:hypothetical protein
MVGVVAVGVVPTFGVTSSGCVCVAPGDNPNWFLWFWYHCHAKKAEITTAKIRNRNIVIVSLGDVCHVQQKKKAKRMNGKRKRQSYSKQSGFVNATCE